MATKIKVTVQPKASTQTRLHTAVSEARASRHHQDCHCGNIRVNNAPYCTAREATATRHVDILIDVLMQERTH